MTILYFIVLIGINYLTWAPKLGLPLFNSNGNNGDLRVSISRDTTEFKDFWDYSQSDTLFILKEFRGKFLAGDSIYIYNSHLINDTTDFIDTSKIMDGFVIKWQIVDRDSMLRVQEIQKQMRENKIFMEKHYPLSET